MPICERLFISGRDRLVRSPRCDRRSCGQTRGVGACISPGLTEWPGAVHLFKRGLPVVRQPGGVQARRFEPGDVIFRQGDPVTGEAYLVHGGAVEVTRHIAGAERVLRTLGVGDLLGEVALFRHGPHSATAVAVKPVVLLVIPADRLEQIVRTRPDLALALIRQLARMAAREDSAS